jgi:hypothetical protein
LIWNANSTAWLVRLSVFILLAIFPTEPFAVATGATGRIFFVHVTPYKTDLGLQGGVPVIDYFLYSRNNQLILTP